MPPGTSDAIAWLESALSGHWDGSKYVSMMADPGNGAQPSPQNPVASGYDPNIDIVQSAVYCAIPVTDTKLLATAAQAVPFDDLSSAFFGQVGVGAGTAPADAVAALDQAGDAMLQAVIYHSDNLELSEQFDGTTGYEKSVHNLTWSYAAFLSAVRAKSARNVQG